MFKLIVALVLLGFVLATGAFAVLAVWDIPVAVMPVEKTLDSSKFL